MQKVRSLDEMAEAFIKHLHYYVEQYEKQGRYKISLIILRLGTNFH